MTWNSFTLACHGRNISNPNGIELVDLFLLVRLFDEFLYFRQLQLIEITPEHEILSLNIPRESEEDHLGEWIDDTLKYNV